MMKEKTTKQTIAIQAMSGTWRKVWMPMTRIEGVKVLGRTAA